MRIITRLKAAWQAFKEPELITTAKALHQSFADMVETGRGGLQVERDLDGAKVSYKYTRIQ